MLRAALTLLLLLATPLLAQEDDGFRFGGDAYLAGRIVTHLGDDTDSLFAMADRVTSSGALAGSAYVFARRITISAPVGVNLYGAGGNITLSAPVSGDAILLGDELSISGPVQGDLRAAANHIELTGAVGDSALLGGQEVFVNAAVGGDLGIGANEIGFGPEARVGGTLHIYGHAAGEVEIPAEVAASGRIVWHESDEMGAMWPGGEMTQTPGFWSRLRDFAGTVIVTGLLATILAAIAPQFLAIIRERALESPLRTGWIGFIALSAAIGSLVVFALTGLGLLLVPVSLLAAFLLGLAGYLVGVYVLGVGVGRMLGRTLPDTPGERAIAAFIGATSMALLGLVPLLGWFATLALVLLGAGGLMVRLFAPGFYTELR